MLTVMSTLTSPDIGKNNVVYDSLEKFSSECRKELANCFGL